MGMIPFFTPVQYRNQATDWVEKVLEIVDGYFDYGGMVAVVVSGLNIEGVRTVQLQETAPPWWQVVLKIASSTAGFWILLAKRALAPSRVDDDVRYQLEKVVILFPIGMLIAKGVLRSLYSFQEEQKNIQPVVPKSPTSSPVPLPQISEKKPLSSPEEEEYQMSSPEEEEYQKIFKEYFELYKEIGTTLDTLLGVEGALQKLPVQTPFGNVHPFGQSFNAPIMKGGFPLEGIDEKVKPFIAIKMQSKNVTQLFLIFPGNYNTPLAWVQQINGPTKLPDPYPNFFTQAFTHAKTGQVVQQEEEGFKLLQTLIKDGRGKDCKGREWTIVGHPNTSTLS